MKPSFIVRPNVFTPAELDAIEELGDALMPHDAGITGAGSVSKVRVTKIAWLERNQRNAPVYARIAALVHDINRQFYNFDVTGLQPFQYSIYHGSEGGHYDWHIDYDARGGDSRKISISIQLSDSAHYEGCDLQFRGGPQIRDASRERGSAIAFPSFFLHRVTPITAGTRKALVIWAAGPEFC